MFTKNKDTIVAYNDNYVVTKERKTWLIFSWYEEVYREKTTKDLVITTTEDYEKIIVNGKEIKL